MAEGSTGETEQPRPTAGRAGATADRSGSADSEPGSMSRGEAERARPPGTRRNLARAGVLAAAAFVLGLFAGAIALGLLMETPPRDLTARDGGAESAPTGTAEADPGTSATIEVNEACLRIINAAQDTVDAIEQLGESAADLDLAGLDEVIRRLQPLQDRLRDNLAACRVDTTLPADLDPSGTPAEGTEEQQEDPEGGITGEPSSPAD